MNAQFAYGDLEPEIEVFAPFFSNPDLDLLPEVEPPSDDELMVLFAELPGGYAPENE